MIVESHPHRVHPGPKQELPALTWDEVIADPALEVRLGEFGLETLAELGILSVYALEHQLTGSIGATAWRLLLDFQHMVERSLILRPWATTLDMSSSHLNESSVYECTIGDGDAALWWRVELECKELEDVWPRVERPRDLLDCAKVCAYVSWRCQEVADFLGHAGLPCLSDVSLLDEMFQSLTPRQQKVLILRFGLQDGRSRTLEEVGRAFNVTRERIRQIEAAAAYAQSG